MFDRLIDSHMNIFYFIKPICVIIMISSVRYEYSRMRKRRRAPEVIVCNKRIYCCCQLSALKWPFKVSMLKPLWFIACWLQGTCKTNRTRSQAMEEDSLVFYYYWTLNILRYGTWNERRVLMTFAMMLE